VIHAPGALKSWEDVAEKLPSQKTALIEGALCQLFMDWIDGARLHRQWAEPEGDLDRGTKFFAIKRIPVRAYFWYSEVHKDTIVSSHYVKKSWQKLRKADIERVRANWRDERSGKVQ
jgi:hypothetical protein